MNPRFLKSSALSFALILSIGFPGDTFAQTGEHYSMDGKPVSRAFYDAGLLVSEGNNLLRANKNAEASVKLKAAVDLAPDFPEAHYNYALAIAKLGNIADAVDQLHLAIKLKPDFDAAWMSLGGVYQSAGQINEAVQAYQEFLKRFPHSQYALQVGSVVQGLQREASGTTVGALRLGMTAPSAPSPQDYLADVTKQGTLRWPSARMPLKVYVKPPVNVAGYKAGFDAIMRQSLSDWAKATNGQLRFQFVPSSQGADIDISWTSDTRHLANRAEAGETRLTNNRLGIVHARVQLLTVPLVEGVPVTSNRIRLISLHEFGHVLGLTGHTSDPHDAMFYSATLADQWRNLSERDKNTIARLYAASTESVVDSAAKDATVSHGP